LIEINKTPIERGFFLGREFLIKRDDLTDREFSGNKARKLHYFLHRRFPHIKRVISYGSAQSNAMYSLSVLSKRRGWEFIYHTSHISSHLKKFPKGNFKEALKNGMKIIEGEFDKEGFKNLPDDTLFIREGGAMREAEEGVRILAKEIESQIEDEKIDIFLPSGTGTTALYLQKHLNLKVYTVPCVGGESYLKKQFLELESDLKIYPTILKTDRKYHFGKLYRELFEIWIQLKRSFEIEFDLLYDPIGWIAIRENSDIFKNKILYIHQGGVLGNETMLERYRRKFEDIGY
jgi:1-aminocyclopropane-1-carboxylate deaminase/D-cysteine desulfhydrase-like pyridoxal-dependent ACC family enzyme